MSLFTPEQLQQLVQENLPATPTDSRTHALIGTVDASGAQVLAVMKFNSVWEVQAAVRHAWSGDTQVGAKVMARW